MTTTTATHKANIFVAQCLLLGLSPGWLHSKRSLNSFIRQCVCVCALVPLDFNLLIRSAWIQATIRSISARVRLIFSSFPFVRSHWISRRCQRSCQVDGDTKLIGPIGRVYWMIRSVTIYRQYFICLPFVCAILIRFLLTFAVFSMKQIRICNSKMKHS